MDEKSVIASARIVPVPPLAKGVPSGQDAVVAVLEGGAEEEVFRYYHDEVSFRAAEFAGLTIGQARDLFQQRDVAYLRS
jgi:hypothetical protein